ncbi:uncharacterized protein [Amphiura filiformis]|uniref:uncharacterized protein n=1 Tax=Amphiura filiformis TaxID=82378 RepID=UPI003B2115F7
MLLTLNTPLRKIKSKPNKHIGLCVLLVLAGDISLNPGPNTQLVCTTCNRKIYKNHRKVSCNDCHEWKHFKCSSIGDLNIFKEIRDGGKEWFCENCTAPCGSCRQHVRNHHLAVGPCDLCEQWFHIDCIGMSEEDYDQLLTKSFDWICTACETSGGQPENDTDPPISPSDPKHSKKRKSKVNARDSLKILLINFQSIKNKNADFEQLIHHHQPDIIQGTETWLNKDISSSEMFPENYHVYRRDRKTDDHGGVVFACKKDIIVTEKDFSSEGEMLWNQIELKGQSSLLLGTVYKPKHDDSLTVDHLQNALTEINRKMPNNNIVICGDFNQPNANWINLCTLPIPWACKHTANKLMNTTVEHGLVQFVTKPTRGNNILDLVFTNNSNIIRSAVVEPGLGDHDIVCVDLDLKPKRKKPNKRKVFIRQKADEKGIKEDFLSYQQSWKDMNTSTVQEKWDSLENEIKAIMDRRVPSKMSSTRHDLPWFSRKHRRLTRCKQRLYNKAKASRSEKDWERFKAIQKTTRRSLQKAKKRGHC